jgi:hypothetical protein
MSVREKIFWIEGVKEGQKLEQERIIKLLEEERWKLPDGSPLDGEVYLPLEQAIALIKEEQK